MNIQDIIKQAQEEQQRTTKLEALFGNILCSVLGLFALSAIIPWGFVG